MNYLKASSISLVSLLLTACGNGGSSTGGETMSEAAAIEASDLAPDIGPAPTSVTETYIGVWRARTRIISSDAVLPPTLNIIDLTITVTDQQVEIRDNGGVFVATGALNSIDRYRAISNQQSLTFANGNILCAGNFVFEGLIVDDVSQGNGFFEPDFISVNQGNCNTGNVRTIASSEGPFRATRN